MRLRVIRLEKQYRLESVLRFQLPVEPKESTRDLQLRLDGLGRFLAEPSPMLQRQLPFALQIMDPRQILAAHSLVGARLQRPLEGISADVQLSGLKGGLAFLDHLAFGQVVDVGQTLGRLRVVSLELHDTPVLYASLFEAIQTKQCAGNLELRLEDQGLVIAKPPPLLGGFHPFLTEIVNAAKMVPARPLVASRSQSVEKKLLAGRIIGARESQTPLFERPHHTVRRHCICYNHRRRDTLNALAPGFLRNRLYFQSIIFDS